MEFYEVVKSRCSIRKYKAKPLPEEALDRIIEAGRLANSARNRQEWAFIVVLDDKTKKRMVPACRDQQFVGEAAVLIIGCATNEYTMRCGQPADAIDTSIALDHMQLAATAEGFGTCWLGAFYQDRVKEILGIPDGVHVVGILTVGIPAETGRAKSRKPASDIIHHERWGKK